MIDCLNVAVFCTLFIDCRKILVLVLIADQSPLSELISITNVVAVVKIDKCRSSRVVIKSTTKLIGGVLEELVPLSFEKLVNLKLDFVGFLNGLSNGKSLMEGGVGDDAGNSYFHLNLI